MNDLTKTAPAPAWSASPRLLLRQLLRLDDTSHAIALGTAIGMFIGWTPTVGIQMLIVLVFAFLVRPFFRFNQFAALVAVYVSNPLTMIPMYWFMYWVGTFFVGGHATAADFAALAECRSMSSMVRTLADLFVDVGLPMMIGSLVLAAICGLLTYPVMRYLLAPRRRPSASSAPTIEEPAAGARRQAEPVAR